MSYFPFHNSLGSGCMDIQLSWSLRTPFKHIPRSFISPQEILTRSFHHQLCTFAGVTESSNEDLASESERRNPFDDLPLLTV